LRFLHHHVGSPPGVFRPPRSNLHDVLLRLSGLDVRPGSSVEQILVRDNRVAGVALKGGEEVATPIVVSALDPRRTMLELADPGWLDPELARSIRHIRCRGTAGRLTLELDRPPGFARLVHAPSLDYLERAYDDAKHGRPSAQPCLEACWDGGTRVEIDVQFAAEAPDAALGLLAPRLGRAAVKARQWIPATQVPASAELTLDQALWRRPHPDLAAYHTPIAGLWLCGDSMHPGDRIAGAAGFNCARGILRSA
jgi:phytoene dehydrogenase-like protein